MNVLTLEHIYPSFISIQAKIDSRFDLSAEEELLHYVNTGQYDKLDAQKMLQEWFPEERFLPII